MSRIPKHKDDIYHESVNDDTAIANITEDRPIRRGHSLDELCHQAYQDYCDAMSDFGCDSAEVLLSKKYWLELKCQLRNDI